VKLNRPGKPVWSTPKLYFSAFTERIDRPGGLPTDRVVALGEAPRGMAPPILAWYPIDASTGYKFIYRTAR
jgi:hypothetical protein